MKGILKFSRPKPCNLGLCTSIQYNAVYEMYWDKKNYLQQVIDYWIKSKEI